MSGYPQPTFPELKQQQGHRIRPTQAGTPQSASRSPWVSDGRLQPEGAVVARLIGPDDSVRMLVLTLGDKKGTFAPPGTAVSLYADPQASIPADVLSTTNDVIAGSPAPEVMVSGSWQIPLFQYPDGSDVVYTQVLGGPVIALYARTDDQIDLLEARFATLGNSATRDVGTTSEDVAAGDAPATAQAAAVGAAAALAIVFGA
jgi:hypothetical protein